MGTEYLFYMKSIETHACAFLTVDILFIGTVLGPNPLFDFQTTSIFSSLFRRPHNCKDDNHLSILNQKFHGYIKVLKAKNSI